MKLSQLRELIKEEISKILNENEKTKQVPILTYDQLVSKYNPEDGPAFLDGLRDEPGFEALSPKDQKYLVGWLKLQIEMDR